MAKVVESPDIGNAVFRIEFTIEEWDQFKKYNKADVVSIDKRYFLDIRGGDKNQVIGKALILAFSE